MIGPGLYKFGNGEAPVETCGSDLPLGIDYTISGTDQNLNSPDDSIDTPVNLLPIKASSFHTNLNIGTFNWQSTGAIGSIVKWDATGNGSQYGGISFTNSTGWLEFASSSFDGPQTFLLPGAGGSFNYYYDNVAWSTAFDDNSNVIIAQNGNVYKGSITADNLVVSYTGVIGKAGGCTIPTATTGLSLPFAFIDGNLTVGDGQIKTYMRATGTVTTINIAVTIAPTVADLQVDVKLLDGLSILPSFVTIIAGVKTGTIDLTLPTEYNYGQIFEIDIKQVGSTVTGADLFIDFL